MIGGFIITVMIYHYMDYESSTLKFNNSAAIFTCNYFHFLMLTLTF